MTNEGGGQAAAGVDPEPSLPGLLREHGARHPERPWLFFRRGRDWRWRPWGAVAGAVEALAGELRRAAAGAGLAPPARIGFPHTARPDDFALDLAVQAAGFAAAPLAADRAGSALAADLGKRGCRGLALLAGGDGATGREVALEARAAAEAGVPLLTLTLPGLAARQRPGASGRTAAPPASAALDAGPVVVAAADPGREISQADLIAGAGRLTARLGPRRGRDVLVFALAADRPAGRLLLAWSLRAGTALALEPEPGHLVASAVWVRPTVFAGAAAERRALGDWLAAHDRSRTAIRRRPRLPLRRLDTVLALDATTADERGFWTRRGASVLSLSGPVV